MQNELGKSRKKILYIIVTILLLVVVFIGVLLSLKIKNITIVGNKRYDEKTIEKYIFSNNNDKNIVRTFINIKLGKKKSIPFIEYYDIKFTSLDSIKITVYEKALIGCVEYKSSYMYFDKDGIIIENIQEKYDKIPVIKGVDVDKIVLYKALFDKNDNNFKKILNFTELIKSDNIDISLIDISDANNLILQSNNIKILMGNDDYLGEKIDLLRDVLPKLHDLQGILYLDTYVPGKDKYIFKRTSN